MSVSNVEEKVPAVVTEELPFFAESYPGKCCCLCGLGERSGLGQGNMLQLQLNVHEGFDINSLRKDSNESKRDGSSTDQSPQRKLKSSLKQKALSTGESNYELDKIGYCDVFDVSVFIDDGCVYVHRMCLMWALRKSQVTSEADFMHFVSNLIEFLEQKCTFCGQYGASVACKMKCHQAHHWPCAAAAGCLLIMESFTVFCTEHLSQVPLICKGSGNDNNVECLTCSSLGDLSKLIMCCTCGDHFHTTCIGLANLPDTRSGWNCARCTKCQICRQQDASEVGRFVKCEQCQKMYHTTCLRPVLLSIPKYGWKCNRCRVCTDCGARTPGGGSSSRWHSHYTICDSCYQQRNKGFSCPICQKAYRAAAYKEMVKCNFCHKFVHSTCDEEADLAAYHKKKENNPDYDYVCPSCKTNPSIESHLCAGGDSSLGESQTSEIPNIKVAEIDPLDGKPSNEMSSEEVQKQQNNRKKVCLGNARGKGAKFMLHRMGVMSQLGKKRSTRGKGRQLVLSNNSSDRYSNRTMDSDFTSDKKMLLCSARDKFILTQDICVMCGSLGIESDAHLITCAQCGQCYHPYCAGVKPSKGMLQKGWRCLDCTVCEGCGKKNDEARLLLCDECDISYHIYCVNPPLDTVPHGNWKCSYCTICQKCGRNLSQKGECTDANTAECPSCISQSFCAVCGKAYNNGDTIIQCEQCQHWSHFSCDSANIHLTINYYEENEYKCMKCRCLGKSQLPSMEEKSRNEEPSASQKQLTLPAQEGKNSSGNDRHDLLANNLIESAEAIHWIDGVCLSENGLNMIKSLSTEIKRKRKVRQAVGNANRDPLLDSTLPDEAPCDKYKDGMIWDGTETVLPEGFTISTNEEGVNILRKKRQRNLQKLGIGGFSVRNRTLKRDNDEAADQLNPVLAMDKKKKTIRKKQKNKLIEAYPAYLQEAFFGKPLLEGADVMTYESDSSDGIDATMKTYFTRFEEKKPEEDAAHASKEPAKFLKKARAEKDIPENKNMFSDQLPTVSQQKGNNGIGPTMFDAISSETPHIGSATNRNVLDNLASNKFLDGTNPTSNFMVNDNIDKALGEQTVVMMDNFNMPPQMPQEAKFAHSQLFVSDATMAANSSQLHYQQDQVNMQHKLSPQVVSTHVNMHNEKKNDEDNRVVEPVPEAMNVGTQKTAEKMRKDEDLGLMATISAVLYANTEHANLKEMYPNWNDRCKQILKKWRSLCNEKKAPFLQKAKDNRSALRQRREQNKISLPPKPQKQEDVGNAWKQHQIKIKEEQSNMFVNYGGIPYDPACYSGPAATHPTSHVGASVGEKFVVQSSVQRTTINAARASPLKITTTENIVESNQAYGSAEIGDKKLRNLLQKPNTEPMLLGPNSELFMSNDVLRLGLISNPSLNQNNPMLSTSGAPQPSELRQNIPELEQDVKIQPDLKITESQEGISASVELENVGFGDILGGLGEGDDDDLLKSLTSEIGDDFNILEYGDPELDVNVLNTLDFEENEKSSA